MSERDEQHGRYEALAVGHVLGGLADADAAAFRAHLAGCEGCRSRVAELRGIASDLAAAERDERLRARVRTMTSRRAEPAGEQGRSGPSVRGLTIMAMVLFAALVALAFWNLHLRTVVATSGGVLDAQAETLRGLAAGVPLEARFADGVQGVVVGDGERVSFTAAGIEPLDDDEVLVAWLERGGVADDGARRLTGPGGIEDGRVATTLETGSADALVVTREQTPLPERPSGDEVLRAVLRAQG